MKLTKTFLKILLPVMVLILAATHPGLAQVTYQSNNTATASGNVGTVTVSDISNNGPTVIKLNADQTPINFPMIGLAKTASTPALQADGTYNIVYTFLVQNYGAIGLKTIQVTDNLTTTFTSPLTYTKVSLTATGTLVVNAGFDGNGDQNLLTAASSTLAVGTSGTITLTVNVAAHGQYGTYNNTSVATAVTNNADAVTVTDASTNNASPNHGDGTKTPLDFTDPTPITISPSDIQVIKTVDNASPNVNTNATFTITVKNLGLGDAAPVAVNDLIGPAFTFVSATPSQGTYDSSTGIWSVGTILVNNTATLTVIAKVLPNQLAASYTNTASSNHPGDPVSTNNSSTVTLTPVPVSDLSITNTDGQATYVPNSTNTYTVVATNAGPSDLTGGTVTYTLPAGATSTWTATYAGGATGNVSGTNNINETVNMPSGSTITYTVVVNIPGNQANSFATTATITVPSGINDPNTANNTATDTDNTTADLLVSITDSKTQYTPGTSNTYNVLAVNSGPGNVNGASVTVPIPGGFTGSWTAVYSGGSSGNTNGTGSINETVNMPAGSTIAYTYIVAVPSSVTGNLVETATITAPSGVTEPTLTNNTVSDTDIQNSISDLDITNTDGRTDYVPGTTNIYTIVAGNTGPSDAAGSTVTYPIPSGSTSSWTAVYAGGATGNTSGTGSINELVNLTAGGTATYTVQVAIPSSQTGNYTTTATVAAANGINDPTPGNNTAGDTDTQNSHADLSITNTDNQTTYIPGVNHIYTVVAKNNGPSDAPGSTVGYTLPSGINSTWTATYAGGATGNANGANNINETVSLPAGASVTYTVVPTIPSSRTGDFTTTATVTAAAGITDATAGNNTAGDTDTQNSQADLSITNTDGQNTYAPGTTNTYTVLASNAGPSDVTGGTITYTIPSGATSSWTAAYTGSATGNASGSNINETVNMPSGSTITYTVVVTVPASQSNSFTTTAAIAVPTGVTDTNTANNSAADTDNSLLDLTITNTDGKTAYIPGTTNTYTIVATNAGPGNVTGATIADAIPGGFTGTWTATYTGGATGNANSTGSINEMVNMPSGSTVTYSYVVSVPSGITSNLTNTATITAPAGVTDSNTANNTASDTDTQNSQSDLSITNTDGKTTYTPGTSNTYMVVASNAGPSDAIGSTITYPVPSGSTTSWTAVYAGGATGITSGTGSINETANIPSGGTITYTVLVAIPSSQTGNYTITATINPASGITDPTPGNNTAGDTDTQNSQADLSITNTDNQTNYIPGTTNTYTVVAKNNGPSDATGSKIIYNTTAAGLSGNWTATYSGGATGNASGTGQINEIVNMPAGGSVTYTAVVNIPSDHLNSITTSATITAATGVTDATAGNNTANDTDTQNSLADLSITNTDGKTTYVPGTINTYTIVATNNGPSNVTGATVSNILPTGVTGNWTAVYTGGATGNTTGTNNINETVNMPDGSTVTYTYVVNIPSATTGNFVNTAGIAAPNNVTDPTPANNIATDTDTQSSQADLSITNTDGKLTYVPGTGNTYTTVVTNNGPSDAPGTNVTYNTTAAGLSGTWTAVYTGGATGNASGTGVINETVNLPAGSTVTYTALVSIPSSQLNSITTTATATAASGITDATTGNNTANDTDLQNSQADLSITNTDGQLTYMPGTTNTYTIVATNAGPSNVTGATVANTLPSGVTGTWTATYTGGAIGNAGGTNSINETVTMPAGSAITYTYVVSIPSSTTGNFSNTATITLPSGVTDATPGNNTATDVDVRNSQADLSITNTDGQATYVPGVNNTYTVVATNNGPSDAPGSVVTYALPSGTNGTWTATYAGGATGNSTGINNISETVSLPSGSSVTYTVIATIPSTRTGSFTTTATVATAAGITDATAGNDTANDTDTQNSQADLSITNTDAKTTYVPGTTNTYTIVATNNGPSNVTGATISNGLPTGVTGNWTATYTGGATGNASGTNNIGETVTMPTGSTITYTYLVNVPSNVTGNFLNTATIATPTGVTDPTPANNTAIDIDLQSSQADLSITNTDDKLTYVPGTSNTYTVVVSNTGPSDAPGTTVTYNTTAAGLTGNWTAVYTGGASGNASGNGPINEIVNLPSGSTVTYTALVGIPSNHFNSITTTATVAAVGNVTDATPGNNITGDTDLQSSQADLSITNTDGKTNYVPGTTNTYTIVATNNGPSDVTGATVTNTLPSGVTGTWTATYTGGASGIASGTNSINETVTMPAGSSITYSYVVSIPSATTGNFTNTATITLPSGVTDPTPANNTASDIDTQNSQADLSVTNTDSKLTYNPGTTNTYTAVATNNGPSDAPGTTITYNTTAAGLTGNWTAVYTGGASGNASGNGTINETVNMPAGSTVTYTAVVTIPSSQLNSITTVASIGAGSGVTDATTGNNSAGDTDLQNSQADLSVTNTDAKTTYVPGTTNTYTIVANNNGTADVTGATINNVLPTGVTGTWSATYTGGATGNASGTNNIGETVNMPAGSTVTYTYVVSIPSNVTGNFVNTATIAAPNGVTDPTPANNTATDTDTQSSQADLNITNTDGQLTYIPGTTNTYTVVATNNGPSDAPNSTVTYNTTAAGLSGNWTATYTGGATGNASGTGVINETVNLPAGSTVTYTVEVAIPSSHLTLITTTATVGTGAGITDATPGNNTASDTDLQNSQADLSITNTDGKATYTPGTTNTYTIIATNNGQSDVTGATITNTLPAGVTGTWTVTYAGGATGNASGTNSINETVTMPAGSTVTYTYVVSIPSTVTGNFTNTATIAVPSGVTDPTPANNTTSDVDTQNSQADLSITNTDGQITYTPGTNITYTVVASNNGPSDAPGTNITYNTTAAGLTGTWTAVYTGGATGNASGTGSINETVNMPAGSTVTYTAVVVVPSSQLNSVVTTANITPASGITDPNLDNNTATDVDVRLGSFDLSVTNTDAKLTYAPGAPNTYTVVAANSGPTDVTGATVTYVLPVGVSAAWTATFTGSATGTASGTGNINETVNIPAGSSITYTVVVTIPSSLTGSITTSAGIQPPVGLTDPVPGNNTADDTDTQASQADLSITNTDGKTTYTPGTNNTYTIVATNSGPSDVSGATASNTLPSGVTGSWTATYTGGATGSASGNGNISEAVTMPAGSTVTYTYIISIPSNVIGDFVNTASIAVPSGATDPTPGNNTATDTDTQNSQADLSITNTDGQTTYTPGTSNTYTIVATNNGPSNVTGASISNILPTGVTGSWTAVYAGGATGNSGGTNNIGETVTMPAGSSVTYTYVVNIPANVSGSFINTANITAPTGVTDSNTANNTATDTDTQNSQADLSITNTDGKLTYIPGTGNTYTIVVSNAGPSDAPGTNVTYNTAAAGLSGNWTAVYTGGATGNASGTGIINETVNMPSGSTVTYTALVSIPSDHLNSITTVATVTVGAGITDATTTNNTASDTDLQNSQADLSITNTDNKANYVPGTINTYVIVATNNGPSDVTGATIANTLPVGVTGAWTATYTGGATGNANGSNSINETVNMPAASTITYTYVVTIPAATTGNFINTATITLPGGVTDATPANNTASDTDTQNSQADLSITNTDGQLTYVPGTTNVYTIIATNNGPSDAPGSAITVNTTAAGLTGNWTATYTGGATGNASGTGVINEVVNMPAGSTVTYIAQVMIPSSHLTSITTTATIAAASGINDATPANNTASDTDLQNSQADLSIVNTDGKTTYTPGTTNTYTIVATNNGPSDVTGATIGNVLPTGVTGNWTAVYAGGATGNASGTNNINESVTMPMGSTITYTYVVNIPASTTGNFTNTANITAPAGVTDITPGNNAASDTDIQNSQADLSITNTDGKLTYIPGTTNTYTVVVTNNGPSDAPNSTVTYNTTAAGLSGNWTAAYAGGATGNGSGTGVINETVNLPAGSSVTYTAIVTIPSAQTGSITTTGTVATASGITDATAANNTASDTDLQNSQVDLGITNTDGQLTYVPGTTNTYTVVVSNTGPSDAPGSTMTYTLPAGVSDSWTATFAGGATGTGSGTGDINSLVNLPAGSSITYTITAAIASNFTGPLTTNATITTATGITDATPGNNSAGDTDVQNSQADLSITNTDGQLTYVPGTTNTYTIVATNNGPSDALGTTINYNTTAAGLSGSWTAVYTGGATGNASGTGVINETVNMPAGSTVTYTATVAIPSDHLNSITTTATISAASGVTDATPANNTASDTDLQNSQADLSITNTDSKLTYTPGTTNIYTIVATNNGPSDVTGAAISNVLPTGVTGNWTAVYTGGATGNTSGTNNIGETVNMPIGSTITYTYVVSIPSNVTGPFVNTASIATPSGVNDATLGNNAATDTDLQNSQADLSITNTDGKLTYVPGTINTYTIVATNNGPSDAPGTAINYNTTAAGLSGNWTASYTGGATGNASGTGPINEVVDMPAGSTITYTAVVTIPSDHLNSITTVATVTAASGVNDATPGNNTNSDTDLQNSQADLSITNTDSKLTYIPGTTNTYTVVATNNGQSDATGSIVTYMLPAGVTGSWTATYTIGANGNTSGTGNINETVNLPAGSTVIYTITATVASNVTVPLTTTATVATAAGVTDGNPGNNTAGDTDLQTSQADLSITNTDNQLTYAPGTNNTYTIVATNNGPSDAAGSRITYNTTAAGLSGNWTTVYTGGATGAASGTGPINELVDMPAGSTVTYTAIVAIPSSQTGSITTVANIAPTGSVTDADMSNNSASDVDVKLSDVDLSITNTDAKIDYTPGTTSTYIVVVTNNGPSDANGATVIYNLPAGVTSTWTAVYAGGATGTASGTNAINELVNMPNGSTITYTIVVTLPSTQTGIITTTAHIVSAAVSGDHTPANNTAIDIDQQNSVIDLKVVKTASTTTPSINTQVTFTLAVANNGPSAATNVTVTDLLPSGFTYVSSTPSRGTYDSSTGTWTIGNMDITDNATLTMVATVNATGSYTNMATVTGAETDSNLANNTSQVTITAKALPVANNDVAITNLNTAVVIDILANDVKAEANLVPSTVTVITQVQHGSVAIDPLTGKTTYTPSTGYSGQDVFTYTVKDANGGTSNIATVTITIFKALVAVNDAATTNPNTAVSINILNNDIKGDAAIDPTTVIIISQPSNGKVTIDPVTGVALYTPTTNYYGNDEFTYTVKDKNGTTSNVATVTIKINDVPVIGLAKAASSVVKALNGSYNVTYLLTVGNYGLANLNSISITDDLSQTFRGETWKVTNIKTLGNLTVNPNYDGQLNIEMLQGTNTLNVGQIEQIQVTVNVVTVDATTTFLNRAYAAGTSVTGLPTTDQSTNGFRADPNKGGDVSPSDPTPVELPKPCIRIPAGFSPNSDGVHDNWVIEGTCIVGGVNMEIYNRWGNLVYKDANYKNDWNGKCNQGIHIGEDLPVGTYYYIVIVGGNDKYVGYLTLNR